MKSLTYRASLLCLVILIQFFTTACEKDSGLENPEISTVTIALIESDSYVIFDKYVVIHEDSKYLIKSPLAYFVSDLGDFFHHNYDQYLTTIDSIIADGKRKDSLNARDYFEESNMDYLLAHFLESGNCHIKDKQNGTAILTIKMEKWGESSAPLSGSGGRRFYINNDLFLEVTDWISK